MGCPYEGEVNPKKVSEITKRLFNIGCYEVSLGDTIGIGTVEKTKKLFEEVLKENAVEKIAAHFHDTFGNALENLLIALEYGVSVIDSSIGGIGGCPYAKKRVGNVSTENVVEMLDFLGIETGVDLNLLKQIGKKYRGELNRDMNYIFN